MSVTADAKLDFALVVASVHFGMQLIGEILESAPVFGPPALCQVDVRRSFSLLLKFQALFSFQYPHALSTNSTIPPNPFRALHA